MDDDIKGFFVGLVVGLIIMAITISSPFVGCRSDFQKEAIGNGCGKLNCDINGACEFEWNCE
ncbi:hypothetical protein LCGC14_0141230 [marine sediment metagenome]|uniref:Transmembrane protein n=1 Tax=marine sediment metagenome TaxID=412755 RepID=A0A0F9VGD0_9ZZZZ